MEGNGYPSYRSSASAPKGALLKGVRKPAGTSLFRPKTAADLFAGGLGKTLAYGALAAEALAETFWPTRCVLCDAPGALLCSACLPRLCFIDHWNACPRCGAPFGRIQCSECNRVALKELGRIRLPFSSCTSAVVFDGASAPLVTVYKDQGEQRLAEVLAEMIARQVPPALCKESYLQVAYLPATRKALRRRGFDHAGLLAEAVAQQLGLGCLCPFEPPRHKDQRGLTRRGRIENMAAGLAVRPDIPLPGRLLLVDDVFTTGSTLIAATDALLSAGVTGVDCATFARVW